MDRLQDRLGFSPLQSTERLGLGHDTPALAREASLGGDGAATSQTTAQRHRTGGEVARHLHEALGAAMPEDAEAPHLAAHADVRSAAGPHAALEPRLHRALGAPVPENAAALQRWREARKHDLSGIARRKLKQTQVMRHLNRQMAMRFRSTSKGLHDFNRASQGATRRPAYFQKSMHNLVTQCESYGDLVGRQIAAVRQMRAQDAAITSAGGDRPTSRHGDPAGADTGVVSGLLSANVDAPDAERKVGASELQSTRMQLSQAIATMRASIESMQRGLAIAQEVSGKHGRDDLASPHGVRQRDKALEPHLRQGGAERRPSGLDGESESVSRLQSQLQGLQQGYDELGFL